MNIDTVKKVFAPLILYAVFISIFMIIGLYFGNKYFLAFSTEYNLSILTFYDYLHLSAEKTVQIFGEGDAASYVKSALFLLKHGYFKPWMSNLWPPGQALMIAAIFKLFGENVYPLKMFYLTAAVWSLAFMFVYHSLAKIKSALLKVALSLLPLYFMIFNNFIFNFGIVLSETTTLPLFVIAVCLFISWLQNNRFSYLLWSVVVFAVLAYIRGYFELFSNLLIVIVGLNVLLKIIKKYFTLRLSHPELSMKNTIKQLFQQRKELLSKKIISLITALLVFSVLLLPWRLYHFTHSHTFSWQSMGSVWPSFWVPKAYFSTANVACEAQPEWCNFFSKNDPHQNLLPYKFYRDMTLVTLVAHPLNWYAIKARNINVLWYGKNNWNNLLENHRLLFIEGIIIFLMGFIAMTVSSFIWPELFLFSSLFVLFNLILFTLFHYEMRYSLYLQLFFIYLPLWLWNGVKSENNNDRNIA